MILGRCIRGLMTRCRRTRPVCLTVIVNSTASTMKYLEHFSPMGIGQRVQNWSQRWLGFTSVCKNGAISFPRVLTRITYLCRTYSTSSKILELCLDMNCANILLACAITPVFSKYTFSSKPRPRKPPSQKQQQQHKQNNNASPSQKRSPP